MRRAIPLALVAFLALPSVAQAQFKRYFDVSPLRIAPLTEPNWTFRVEEHRLRYMCLSGCPYPTGVEIKGEVRGEKMPEAFESGPLDPATLKAQGEATASRLGSTFLSAEPITVAGQKGVQMEASVDLHGTIYFIKRWIGQGERLLEIKVTTRDRALARQLAGTATESLVPQVFGK